MLGMVKERRAGCFSAGVATGTGDGWQVDSWRRFITGVKAGPGVPFVETCGMWISQMIHCLR